MTAQPTPERLGHLLNAVCGLRHRRMHELLDELGLYRGQPAMLRALWAGADRLLGVAHDGVLLRRGKRKGGADMGRSAAEREGWNIDCAGEDCRAGVRTQGLIDVWGASANNVSMVRSSVDIIWRVYPMCSRTMRP